MTDPDTVEAVLLQAAGTHHPSSMDISPILALIELGYDLDRDIVPVIKRMVPHAKGIISSWRYFVSEIKARPLKPVGAAAVEDMSGIHGDYAGGERPVWWVRGDDPRYEALAIRWAADATKRLKKRQRRPVPIESKYFKGKGWAFPAHWVGDPPTSL
jgi:hypothetical protein